MTKGNWPISSLIGALAVMTQAMPINAFELVSSATVQSYLDQKLINPCETFCLQSISVSESEGDSASFKLIATNSMTVEANLALSVTVASSTTASENTIPAQTSYYVYQGDTVKSFSYTAHPIADNASHNDSITYELPWERGEKHISLNGLDDYFEFSMPLLTPVIAARAGTIVGIKENKEIRDFSSSPQDHAANEIIIQHDDNSFGIYKNIAQNGALVSLGDSITSGESIAFSGQTGNAVNPKLTFYVTANANLVDINFITDEGVFSYFTEFEPYTAVHANSTIDPDLSFENDLGLGSNGETSSQETVGDTGGDTNNNTGGNNSGDSNPDNNNGGGNNSGGSDSGGNNTDSGDTGGSSGGDSGSGTGDSGTNTGGSTAGDANENTGGEATQSSGGGGGGSTSPILMLALTFLYIYRKNKRVL